MTKEEMIVEIANLNSIVGALQAKLIERNILTQDEINSVVKMSLELGKQILPKVGDETVNKDKILELLEKRINSL